MTVNIPDGEYTIELSLTGGGGKASLTSPANVSVSDGNMTAELEWSSPYYDLMTIYEDEYYPENTGENSVFYVNVPDLDSDIPITARTTAMSVPHTIEYTLRFSSDTVKKSGGDMTAGVFTGAAFLITLSALIFVRGKFYAKK